MTLAYLATMATSSVLAASTEQLFTFSTSVNIENSIFRPNGHLLLTTFDNGRLYTLDPSLAYPEAELIAALPGATAITGIASIGTDKYAVAGGIRGSYHYDNETIYTVDFAGNANATIAIVATVPDASLLNGMASLPANPHIVLVGDAVEGCIFRVDTTAGTSEVAFSDELLTVPANATLPLGVNGLKVNGSYAYFTNTARNIFARVPISDMGDKIGDIEVIAEVNADAISAGYDWDDFVLDAASGNAYVAQSSSELVKVALLDGEQTIVAGGANSSALVGPTSVTLTEDGKTAYVTTRGGTVNWVVYYGQVVEVQL
ncbi:uncharacterized protein BCR38DRAFT_348056 [Pseudomassariella vexata]|uniref:Six-bladed beta-propeller-like protein n=1 Tax=Pseudomassariella vexata TaxID=1141098 RepID=A0A1Y2DT01_9PEZI|nr:uncharacterized protein BCR38DRAFT_348056 [Pseudomassariella vexata]ORY61785.1 hypothetical protein BCR38DRAFT_348056 [Pseudomassariella vexata]